MASNSICTTCLRALRQQTRSNLKQSTSRNTHISQRLSQRTFATSIRRNEQSSEKPPPAQKLAKSDIPAPSSFESLASTLRATSRSTTEPYIAYGATEDLFQECTRQCSYTVPSALETPPAPPPTNAAGEHIGEGSGWWLTPKAKNGLGLEVTFNSWAQVLYLHMWMLTVRLRCFPEQYVKDWHQNLLDHFFYAAEDRMAMWHGMSARGVRNKNLKDLWLQWRGVQLGYDEGLIKGDAVMGTAIWRNIFKADPGVDVSDVALATAYVMRELQGLGSVGDIAVTEGRVKFGDPRTLSKLLAKDSPLMKQRLTAEELKEPEKMAKGA